MNVKFGPSGLGGVKEAISNLEKYKSLGFTACELAFTYSNYIKNEKDARKIGTRAKELGIQLSIHGSYFVNLNSEDSEKVEKSKERILEGIKIGTWLGATKLVIHPGYYGKRTPEETYEKVKEAVLDIQEKIKENEYTCKMALETTGKINVFGSIDETLKLVEETGCDFCIDFAHILAREKSYMFDEVFEKFKDYDEIHIQFSGINYTEKGERNHIETKREELKELISHLPKNKNITIINESPTPIEDSIKALEIYGKG
ncbi:MAG: TIM barrel protein [Nanoarchaeota archaeon]